MFQVPVARLRCASATSGKDKVGTPWRLFCLVHNIEKIAKQERRA